jgi:hypothetical protein
MPSPTPSERRRKTRLQRNVRVILSGVDADGFKFAEETETVTLSKGGAALRTAYTLRLGQEITVNVKETDRVGQFQVVWMGQKGTSSEGKVGIEWVGPRRFWGIEFAPEDWGKD